MNEKEAGNQGEYKYKVGQCEAQICVTSSDQIETLLKWRHRIKVATVSMIMHAPVLKMVQ